MSAKNYRKATATKIAVAAILSVAAIGGRELALKTALKPLEAPTPANANGVVTAEEWAEVYPEIYESYKANDENTYRTDYLEDDPYLVTVYEGFGFA